MSGVVRKMLLALGSVALLAAAEPLEAQGAGPEYRQFDFVVGNWLVRDSSGRAIGTVTVASEYGGWVLIERWRGAENASEGLGIIGYQARSKTWRREYLDRGGVVLTFEGRREGTTMVLTAKEYEPDLVRIHRVTWTPRSDGLVETRWEISTDAGTSWRTRLYGSLQRIAE